MKKAFKETTVGSILTRIAPNVIDVVGDVFPPVKLLNHLIDSSLTKPLLPPETQVELEKALREYELKEYEMYIQEQKMYLDDVANARDMQKAALQQDDLFSKRFTYYLAAASLFVGFLYVFLITFTSIPTENQRFADTILGVVITMVITTIYQYFFGSSKGSSDKNNILKSVK